MLEGKHDAGEKGCQTTRVEKINLNSNRRMSMKVRKQKTRRRICIRTQSTTWRNETIIYCISENGLIRVEDLIITCRKLFLVLMNADISDLELKLSDKPPQEYLFLS